MGMVYRFSRANAKALKEAKNTDGVFDAIDYDTDIAEDLEREDFISSILEVSNQDLLNGVEKEIAIQQAKLLSECDLSIVSKKMVERAIDILSELDAKIASMPWDRNLASRWCAGISDSSCNDLSKCKYVEPCSEGDSHVYFGPSREFANIVKEVAKVYGSREYHYGYPWNYDEREFFGSRMIREVLQDVLTYMKDMDDGFVVVLRRF